MLDILKTAEEFFTINKIKVNPTKSELIVVNISQENRSKGIDFMNNTVFPKKEEATRYLGIWIEENGRKKYQKELIKEKVSITTSLMIRKYLTDKQARYIINHVLFPQIEYLLQDFVY